MRKILFLSVVILSLAFFAGRGICEEYRIETGDLLLITVYDQDDLTTKVRVTKGEISFPLIGNVRAEGVTVAELAKTIEEMLQKDYLVNPKVNVVIEEYLPRKIFILGAVERPGAYELPANKPTTAIEAIAMAGGFNKVADQNGTKVIRKENGKETSIKVRAGDITQKGQKDKDVTVLPNDVVFVPESFF